MDRQELQSRRAANQIWNGAGRYDVPPEQAAFDADGDPRLYMNTIIGLASRDYDFTRFQPMLHTFEQQPQGGVYADVFWMGLENALYEKEAPRRPVLTALRQEYARAHRLHEARDQQQLEAGSDEPHSGADDAQAGRGPFRQYAAVGPSGCWVCPRTETRRFAPCWTDWPSPPTGMSRP